jgi:hypothetical protein
MVAEDPVVNHLSAHPPIDNCSRFTIGLRMLEKTADARGLPAPASRAINGHRKSQILWQNTGGSF